MQDTERDGLDRLLDMSEQERDEAVRRQVDEAIPVSIPELVKAFVEDEAYMVVLDDYNVLDVVREALAATWSSQLYTALEYRAAEREEEKEEEGEDEE